MSETPRAEELTDDTKELLKAAYRKMPGGQSFALKDLDLPKMTMQARLDCARSVCGQGFTTTLSASWEADGYLGDTTDYEAARAGDGVWEFALTSRGRLLAKQLIADGLKERQARRWAIAKGTWAALMTIALAPLLTDWIKGKFSPPTPPQQTAPATTQPSR